MRQGLAGLVVVAAFAFTGCVEIKSDTAGQRDDIGDVVVTTQICASQIGSPCAYTNTYSRNIADTGELLVAYRVPDGVTPPAEISVAGGDFSLRLPANASYATSLTTASPPAPGYKWVGYKSTDIPKELQGGGAPQTVTARFALVRGGDGSPYAEPQFAWRTVVGYRQDPDLARDVTCATPPHQSVLRDVGGISYESRCVDSPESPGPTPVYTTDNPAIAVRDLGVLDGGTVTAEQGETLTAPFTVRATGDGIPDAELFASTTAPGTRATPVDSTFTPLAGAGEAPVAVEVGDDTAPGLYDIRLSARVGAVERRTGTMKLEVVEATGETPGPSRPTPRTPNTPPADRPGDEPPGGDAAPLIASFTPVRGQKLGAALRRGMRLRVRCSEACAARITLKRGRKTVAVAKGRRASAGVFRVRAKFRRRAKRRYRDARSLRLSARLVVTDGDGRTSALTRRIRLKR